MCGPLAPWNFPSIKSKKFYSLFWRWNLWGRRHDPWQAGCRGQTWRRGYSAKLCAFFRHKRVPPPLRRRIAAAEACRGSPFPSFTVRHGRPTRLRTSPRRILISGNIEQYFAPQRWMLARAPDRQPHWPPPASCQWPPRRGSSARAVWQIGSASPARARRSPRPGSPSTAVRAMVTTSAAFTNCSTSTSLSWYSSAFK